MQRLGKIKGFIPKCKNNWLQAYKKCKTGTPKQAWKYHSQGNRNLGRPTKRRSDQI